MAGIPQAWLDELNGQCALITDPDGRAAVLDEMAYAAHHRREVNAENRVEMLELSEAARAWGLAEFELAYHIGLFKYETWKEGEVTTLAGSWLAKRLDAGIRAPKWPGISPQQTANPLILKRCTAGRIRSVRN